MRCSPTRPGHPPGGHRPAHRGPARPVPATRFDPATLPRTHAQPPENDDDEWPPDDDEWPPDDGPPDGGPPDGGPPDGRPPDPGPPDAGGGGAGALREPPWPDDEHPWPEEEDDGRPAPDEDPRPDDDGPPGSAGDRRVEHAWTRAARAVTAGLRRARTAVTDPATVTATLAALTRGPGEADTSGEPDTSDTSGGPGPYRVPAAMAAFVRARDLTCRFPGCRQPARRCDIDHTRAWPTGPTHPANLICLCRRHHRLKQTRRWQVRLTPAGTAIWISPTGRVRLTRPPERTRHRS